MSTGPQGQRRPGDAIGAAVMVGKIAISEIKEVRIDDSDLTVRGRKGGDARARSVNSARRNEIAKRASSSRWTLERARS